MMGDFRINSKKRRTLIHPPLWDFCYLFGSYAKGTPKPTSDVDFLISTNVTGLKFYGLVEEIRTELHKKVDVLDVNQLKDNIVLTEEILKDGIKIYG